MATISKKYTITTVASNSSWIPTPGTSTVISVNGIDDVMSPPTPTTTTGSGQGSWHRFDQSGMSFNPYGGPNGSVVWGPVGGHFGYKGNEVIECVVQEAAAHARLTNNYPDDIYQTIGSGNNGWYDLSGKFNGMFLQGTDEFTKGTNVGNNNFGDYNTQPWVPGGWYGNSPPSIHSRGCIVFVPGGTDNAGQMVVPYVPDTYAGQSFRYAHIFDVGRARRNAAAQDTSVPVWKRGGRLPIPNTTVVPNPAPNGFTTSDAMPRGEIVWYEDDQKRVGIIGTTSESSVARTIFYLATDQHPTRPPWEWFVGPRTGSAVFMYMNTDSGGCYIPHRRLLLHSMPPNKDNGGAQPGGTGCIQFQFIDLGDPNVTFFTPIKMQFTNPQAGPQMPYSDRSLPNQPHNWTGIHPVYCPLDGAIYFVWTSRHLQAYNPPYQLGDVTIWRLAPSTHSLKGGNGFNGLVMTDRYTWTDMTPLITPKLDCELLRFLLDNSTGIEKVTQYASDGRITVRHQFADGTPVRVVRPSPTNLSGSAVYYVRDVLPSDPAVSVKTSLKLSATPGGAAITFGSNYTPTFSHMYPDSLTNPFGVLDCVYRGTEFIPSINSFVFERGSHGAASPYAGKVQLWKPPDPIFA